MKVVAGSCIVSIGFSTLSENIRDQYEISSALTFCYCTLKMYEDERCLLEIGHIDDFNICSRLGGRGVFWPLSEAWKGLPFCTQRTGELSKVKLTKQLCRIQNHS